MTETLEHNSATFTFERVDDDKELPEIRVQAIAQTHEGALKFWIEEYSRHVTYWTPKKQLGRKAVNVYAFTKGE